MREWRQRSDKSATGRLHPQEILWLYCLWPWTHTCSHRGERASESCNHTSHSCKIASTATQQDDIQQAENYTTANKRGTAHHKNSHPDGQNNLKPGSDEPVMPKIDNWWEIAVYTSAYLTYGAKYQKGIRNPDSTSMLLHQQKFSWGSGYGGGSSVCRGLNWFS